MAASYADIVKLLQSHPAASLSWAEGFVAAGLSMSSAIVAVETMSKDVDSPLRDAEEGLLRDEIRRVNLARGSGQVKGPGATRFTVSIRNVLSAVERTRVQKAIGGFCQPVFETKGQFSRSGHAVMNAVRRATTAYVGARVPPGAMTVEVGPDVKNWMLSPTPSNWVEKKQRSYVGARPVLGPRDVVRVKWERLAQQVCKYREQFYSAMTVEKAELMLQCYTDIFPNRKIQDVSSRGEYIVSYDANYDVSFSDMPLCMAMCGARSWTGCMVRAKALTSSTRVKTGELDLLGVRYRVDWQSGRIDFRHPECTAFGYSHNVWEYMKYEERNGYVWTTRDCHYVYTKGPETTDELLFFSVVRVPKVTHMVEPRFVEHPQASRLEVTSVWATGGEVNGVPTEFSKVKFHVDALNFSKVLEKRRALDHRGDLMVTVSLVRSTNVRFWLNGTPVGASERIEAKLAEAAAVAVEVIVAERRKEANMLFERANFQFDSLRGKDAWVWRMLASLFDARATAGAIAAPVLKVWSAIRGRVIDVALSPLKHMHVAVEAIPEHVKLEVDVDTQREVSAYRAGRDDCSCLEQAELETAIALADTEDDASCLRAHLVDLRRVAKPGCCKVSLSEKRVGNQREDDSGYETEGHSGEESDSCGVSDEDDCEMVDVAESWRSDENSSSVEHRSMVEFAALEAYLQMCLLTEVRLDSGRLRKGGRITEEVLRECTTSRTTHGYVEVLGQRIVRRMGVDFGDFSALYDHDRDRFVKVVKRNGVSSCSVGDGWYYISDALKVWNSLELVEAANYALDYGRVSKMRASYKVTVGVPGAGKTYSMMLELWNSWKHRQFSFLVLAATNAAVASAVGLGKRFGFPEEVLIASCMSIDKYLMHKKGPADVVCVDEFVAMHMGKVDAAVAISGARNVKLYGDAKQIAYDPFCSEFRMRFAVIGDSVPACNVTFLPKSHRLSERMCAVWLDQYPSIYPCDCCDVERKQQMSVVARRVNDLSSLELSDRVRYHAFRQAEKEELRLKLGFKETAQELRVREIGGLATTHEDQGSTHDSVVTVRVFPEYDKNASTRNPSLYNRVNYVLSDMTRAKYSYEYWTMCAEDDEVVRRVNLAGDGRRLELVRAKKGFGDVSVQEMLW